MTYNVLILPIGTEVGLEIYRALRYSKHFEVYGIASGLNNHGHFVCENYICDCLPSFIDSDFWQVLSTIVEKYNIDFIYPASPLLFDVLEGIPNNLKEKLILSDFETVSICRSKMRTYTTFNDLLSVPKITEDKFPIFLKPDSGQGTSGCHVADNKADFDALSCLYKNLLPLEYIDGPEYTIDCFTDRHKELRFVGARERNRIKNGISVNTHIVKNERFKPIAHIINSNLSLRGGWFFQVKGKDLTLLEIEPRIAGTSGIWRQAGVNLPLLTLYDFCGEDVEIQYNDCRIALDRALKAVCETDIFYQAVYVDLDDTLIINNEVNTSLIEFLYQCRNRAKRIYLLTRNKHCISELNRCCINTSLFTDIKYLPDQLKSNYIKDLPAIFIDDSFGERKEVKNSLGIPVFDIDAIECLKVQ